MTNAETITAKLEFIAPKTPYCGWRGRVRFSDGSTLPVVKYCGGGIVSFDTKDQLTKAATRVAKAEIAARKQRVVAPLNT